MQKITACLIVLFATVPGIADSAQPDATWDAVFDPRESWAGGDAAYSIDLRDGRCLWLFADTWIGDVTDGRRAPGTRMVNNTIAVHPLLPDGQVPKPGQIRFHWGPEDAKGDPRSWITPDPQSIGRSGWFWPSDGAVVRGDDGNDRLVITLWQMDRRSERGGGAFNFKQIGQAVAVIDNPHDPPDRWRIVQHRNPYADSGITWGVEVLPRPGESGNEVLYIFGTRRDGGWSSGLVLARVDAARPDQRDAWSFRTSDGWSPSVLEAMTLAPAVPSELSVQKIHHEGRDVWVMVHSQLLFGDRVLVRTADHAEGPWSKPIDVYRVTELQRSDKYFTYAAKAHPQLSRRGELLAAYVVNGHDFWGVMADASIYRPRFIRIPLNNVIATGSNVE